MVGNHIDILLPFPRSITLLQIYARPWMTTRIGIAAHVVFALMLQLFGNMYIGQVMEVRATCQSPTGRSANVTPPLVDPPPVTPPLAATPPVTPPLAHLSCPHWPPSHLSRPHWPPTHLSRPRWPPRHLSRPHWPPRHLSRPHWPPRRLSSQLSINMYCGQVMENRALTWRSRFSSYCPLL